MTRPTHCDACLKASKFKKSCSLIWYWLCKNSSLALRM